MKPEVFTENTSFQSGPQEAAEVPVLTTDATRACSAVHRPLQPIDLRHGELARFIVVPMDHRCRNLKWILFFQSILGIYNFLAIPRMDGRQLQVAKGYVPRCKKAIFCACQSADWSICQLRPTRKSCWQFQRGWALRVLATL